MIFKRSTDIKRYKNESFSFEYPSYMVCKSREEEIISFFKKRNPVGVIRMWYGILDDGVTRQEIVDSNFEHAKEESNDEVSKFNFGGFTGVKWMNFKSTNPFIDGLYWRNGGIHPLFKKKMPDDPMQFALTATTLSSMLMYHWQITNDNITIDINYRTYYRQTEKSKIEMDKELALVEKQIKTIRASH